jgi:hypothetical protein
VAVHRAQGGDASKLISKETWHQPTHKLGVAVCSLARAAATVHWLLALQTMLLLVLLFAPRNCRPSLAACAANTAAAAAAAASVLGA